MRSRIPGIEGLRGIAAFTILVYHTWLYAAPGGVEAFQGPLSHAAQNLRAGVTLFFALSGFLLYQPWADGRGYATRRYLRNRFLRIAPAYIVILLAVATFLEHTLWSHPLQLLSNAFLTQNYVPAYIFGAGIVPAWSLCIEVTFYAALPALGWVAMRYRNPWLPVIGMTAVGIAAKAMPVGGPVWGLTLLTHADWFAAGMAVAVLYRRELPRWWRPAAIVGVPVFALAGALAYDASLLSYLDNQTPIAVACGLLLLLVVREPGSRLVRLLESRPAVLVGLASYSVFLWHDPLLRWLSAHGATFGGYSGFLVNLALIAAITFVLSAASYRFVEKPALALKSRRRAAPVEVEAPAGQPAAAQTV